LHKDTPDEATVKALMEEYRQKGRDNARTPMHWDTTPNAGFTTGTSWIRVNDTHREINAATQIDEPQSVYHCWRQVLEKRKALKDIFVYGDFELVDEENPYVFAYKRTSVEGDAALVVCNFSTGAVTWKMVGRVKEILVSPAGKTLEDVSSGEIQLGPCEGVAVLLSGS
jgi:glycosidase